MWEVLPLPAGAENGGSQECKWDGDAEERVCEPHVGSPWWVGGGRLLIGIAPAATLPSEGDQEVDATGSSKLNVEPSPGTDSTQI
jgi:hypothetical protein